MHKLLNPKTYINKLDREIKRNQLYKNEKKLYQNAPNFRVWKTSFSEGINEPWVNHFYFDGFIPDSLRKDYVNSYYKPQLEYFSVFGKRNTIKKSKSPVKIFWTGEDVVNNYTSFRDQCIEDADLILGFTSPEKYGLPKTDKFIRFPLWILYYFDANDTKDTIYEKVKKINSIKYPKTEFCSLIARHDPNSIRKSIIDNLNQVEIVKCAGRYLHNDDSLKNNFNDDKIKYLQQFMFNLCPENTNIEGYVTEKLFQSFDSGAIPIYWGYNENPEPEVVNPKAIIFYNPENPEQMIQQTKELWTNKNAYEDFINQPRLLDSAVDFVYNLQTNVKQRYEEIFIEKGLLCDER